MERLLQLLLVIPLSSNTAEQQVLTLSSSAEDIIVFTSATQPYGASMQNVHQD